VGLPRELGGIPLDEIGATGFGLAAAVEVACNAIGLDLKGARVAVQGFGAVGKHATRFLSQQGCILVACSDSHGTLSLAEGIDVTALISLKNTGRSVTDFPLGNKADTEAVIDIPCDIWIPAARHLRPGLSRKGPTSRAPRRRRLAWNPAVFWFCPTSWSTREVSSAPLPSTTAETKALPLRLSMRKFGRTRRR